MYPDVHGLRRRLPRRGDGRAHEAVYGHLPQLLGSVRHDGEDPLQADGVRVGHGQGRANHVCRGHSVSPDYSFTRTGQKPKPTMRDGILPTTGMRRSSRRGRGGAKGSFERSARARTCCWIRAWALWMRRVGSSRRRWTVARCLTSRSTSRTWLSFSGSESTFAATTASWMA